MSKTPTIVKCPQCSTSVEWGEHSPFRPFCSKQCQMIDFGEWASEEKHIPGTPDISDTEVWSDSDLS
ncbi:DNA gyrase inhibitor YacG [Vibrio palustris]|uniref:DNA gyrase inhibitor YacG n=1 Tax=Vibrio palustris TaxID=1918946 RepID=A0A1R4B8X6_9VIBR|nr:DNA gyrase inhibitor YacG [Vibrio palustris]SJL85374.1 DNA gyrase inhibitor YacG [Vibrio palustris]